MPYVTRQTIYEGAAVVSLVAAVFCHLTHHGALATGCVLLAIPLAVLAR